MTSSPNSNRRTTCRRLLRMTHVEDKFIQMVSATADVDLRLSDFKPRSMLVVRGHDVDRAKFSVIDYHNHLDAQEPRGVLQVMDSCNIEKVVNITMRVGDEALAIHERFKKAASDRFE